jgi:hypothetical protein
LGYFQQPARASHAWSSPLLLSLCAGLHRKSVNANRPNLFIITISLSGKRC